MFGALSRVSPGVELDLMGTRVRLPRAAGLVLEKLVTDRTGEKGERDLLVALGLLMTATPDDLDDARQLVAEGRRPEPAGDEFEPPKLIVFATRERVARLRGARPVPVRLGRDLLAATCLVLVPFVTPASRGRTRRA